MTPTAPAPTTNPASLWTFSKMWAFGLLQSAQRLYQGFATQFRGRPPQLLGVRAYARSQGYQNADHMRKTVAAARAAQEAAEAARAEREISSLVGA